MLLLSKLVTKVVGVAKLGCPVQPGQDYDAWSLLGYQHKLLEIGWAIAHSIWHHLPLLQPTGSDDLEQPFGSLCIFHLVEPM